MGRLTDLLNEIGSGEVAATDAAEEVRELCRARAQTSSWDETMRRMAGALEDRDPTDTFIEVSAAWMVGEITDEDHAVLYEAVTGLPFGVAERDGQ